MQSQIDSFTASLQSLATEYSDPAILLQQVPVLRDHMDKVQVLLDNWQAVLGGLIALLVLRKVLRGRKRSVKSPAMVIVPPYTGEDGAAPEGPEMQDAPTPLRAAKRGKPARPARRSSLEALAEMTSPRTPAAPAAAPKPTPEQELADVTAVPFIARPALTADEARMRVIVQAALNELKAPYMIMARTQLSALLEPARETTGPARAAACAGITEKTLDLGLFDRAGRLTLALDLHGARPATPAGAQAKAVVTAALSQAGICSVTLDMSDAPADVIAKITPYLPQATLAQQMPHGAQDRSARARPNRHIRPASPSAIAAE